MNDCEPGTSIWLKFDMADQEYVALLKCTVSTQFSTKPESMGNFKPALIKVPLTSIFLPSRTLQPNMHIYLVLLLKEQQSPNIVNYAPIVRCFTQASIDNIDTSFIIVKDKLAFTKIM